MRPSLGRLGARASLKGGDMNFSKMRLCMIGLLSTTVIASPAFAQSDPDGDIVPPVRQSIDANGVNLATGKMTTVSPSISIGANGNGLSYQRTLTQSTYKVNWDNPYYYAVSGSPTATMSVSFAGQGIDFTYNSGTGLYDNKNGGSETLVGSGTNWTFTAADGTIVQLNATPFNPSGYSNEIAVGTSMTLPNKQTLTFGYRELTDFDGQSHVRIQSVRTSSGYMAKLEYATNSTSYSLDWTQLTKITLLNLATDYCNPVADSCAFSQSWPSLTFTKDVSDVHTVTDNLGRQTIYRGTGGLTAIRRPGSPTDNVVIAHDNLVGKKVASVTRDGRTWSYSWSLTAPLMTATITNPDQTQRVVVTDTTTSQVKSERNELNKTTTYDYDSKGRLTLATYPEGNKVQYTYDSRGNAIEQRSISKTPGTPPDIVISASYSASCTNVLVCNKPNSTTDARGFVTDYTYDPTHGGLLTITSPAPTAGAVRPQTRYGYTTKQGYFKNSSGSIVASGQNTYLLASVSSCQTAASCAGTADEVKATVDYGPQSAGVANNLLPVSISKGSGDGLLTASQTSTYDAVGNTTYVDGPLAGAGDTSRLVYDAGRQLIGQIGPDPDGAGPLVNRASRTTYNADGQVAKVEQGTTSGQDDANWATFTAAETVDVKYDAAGLATEQKLSGSGGVVALAQASYDLNGRQECTATRMNPAVYGALPASACVLGTAGSYGPDRIARNVYDAAGRLTQVQIAVGSAGQANERTMTYSDNGSLLTLKDAENNLTTYTYDGFDRLEQTRYPAATKGAGVSSATDYKQLTYDASSNVTGRRLRDGQNIAFGYDNLDRVTLKNLPGTEPDVTYAYDNLDRVTSASQPGNALSFTYDALGRNLTQVSPLGTVASQWDAAGRRTRLTYPGSGLYVDYDYLVTGEMTKIRENAASSGIGVLATFVYDDLGRRTLLTYGNGVTKSYTYDAVSRLTSLTANLAGTANDLTVGNLTYNPANQIISQPRSNNGYSFSNLQAVNRNYTSNGLNQYATITSIANPTYDARGNLTAAGGATYGYSSENALISASNGVALAYDPGHRLAQISSGSSTTRFAYDGLNLIAEFDGGNLLLRRYVFGPGFDEALVQYEGMGTTTRRFMVADERGSIFSVTDDGGASLSTNTYDEYGIPGGGNAGRFQYTGQTWLPELGMYYYKARVYSPTMGRFLQTDLIGYGDGMNMYAYVHGDPINGIDPLGLEDLTCTGSRIPTGCPSTGGVAPGYSGGYIQGPSGGNRAAAGRGEGGTSGGTGGSGTGGLIGGPCNGQAACPNPIGILDPGVANSIHDQNGFYLDGYWISSRGNPFFVMAGAPAGSSNEPGVDLKTLRKDPKSIKGARGAGGIQKIIDGLIWLWNSDIWARSDYIKPYEQMTPDEKRRFQQGETIYYESPCYRPICVY